MIRVFNNLESLSKTAAQLFVEQAQQAIQARGCFTCALSGGDTPHRLYELLASEPYREQIHWESVHFFWGDERCVPPNDARSNARMAHEALLDHIPLPADNIHAVHGDLSPEKAAKQYEIELRKFFGDQPPAFDLILLGLGSNGHTASLFPHTPVLAETKRWVSAVYVSEQAMHRVTFTVALINQARQVVFLVSGAEKALALQNVLEGAYQPLDYPAQLIHPNGVHPLWLVDKAAGCKLSVTIEDDVEL